MASGGVYGGGDGSSEFGNYGPSFNPGCGPVLTNDRTGLYPGGGGTPGPYASGGSGPYSSQYQYKVDKGAFCWGRSFNQSVFQEFTNPKPNAIQVKNEN